MTFNIIVTMENMINGQRIISYELDALVNNKWINVPVPNGQTVGHKVVDLLSDQVTATEVVEHTISNSYCIVSIQYAAVYEDPLSMPAVCC